jgi:ribosome maturation factor RimP
MSKITDIVWTLAEPIVKAQDCELWDVEYVKEAGAGISVIY